MPISPKGTVCRRWSAIRLESAAIIRAEAEIVAFELQKSAMSKSSEAAVSAQNFSTVMPEPSGSVYAIS
jgi:hypothetical protein